MVQVARSIAQLPNTQARAGTQSRNARSCALWCRSGRWTPAGRCMCCSEETGEEGELAKPMESNSCSPRVSPWAGAGEDGGQRTLCG